MAPWLGCPAAPRRVTRLRLRHARARSCRWRGGLGEEGGVTGKHNSNAWNKRHSIAPTTATTTTTRTGSGVVVRRHVPRVVGVFQGRSVPNSRPPRVPPLRGQQKVRVAGLQPPLVVLAAQTCNPSCLGACVRPGRAPLSLRSGECRGCRGNCTKSVCGVCVCVCGETLATPTNVRMVTHVVGQRQQ